jgi:hypothetical protein
VGPVLGVCLALTALSPMAPTAESAPSQVFVPGTHFTLSWMHSIEKVRWEEDYVVRPPQPGAALRLQAVQARVHGSAAGMEPPPDAVLRNGWYAYTPGIPFADSLPLTRSEFTADFTLCADDECHLMAHWLPSDGGITNLTPCSR